MKAISSKKKVKTRMSYLKKLKKKEKKSAGEGRASFVDLM